MYPPSSDVELHPAPSNASALAAKFSDAANGTVTVISCEQLPLPSVTVTK